MKKYALLGEKLSHSYSPLIHNEIFKDLNIDASYELIELKIEDLKPQLEKLKSLEYSGYNVTIPYKVEIMKYLDIISDEALKIGSVNTVALENGKLVGYNTDYYGFYEQLKHFNVEVKDKNCFILGTGGASRAIYKVLIDMGGIVKFVSRNPKDDLSIGYDRLDKEKIDIIVNTTPIGMYPKTGVSPIDKSIAKRSKNVVDIIFNPRKTQLLIDANSDMDGLYMLVGQAIKAEEIWQNKKYTLNIPDLLKRIEELI